ncbi:hypothetical protein G5I_09594 [Acromyrmex echinatior]|uniref:Uncharacterized protein n=1 Tax=Acromyrmex echinatior TaxID=103372 RepID=F4WUL9_ACREC|nr:hypothetical protein G5I_09594 [Acromyrmex echinatior]
MQLGLKRELKPMSQSGYCFRFAYSNGNRNSIYIVHSGLAASYHRDCNLCHSISKLGFSYGQQPFADTECRLVKSRLWG